MASNISWNNKQRCFPINLIPPYRVFLRIGVENLGLLPGVQSVVYQGGQHHVVVEVGAVRVLVQVDGMEQDPQSVGREAGDGVPEGDAVTLEEKYCRM